MPKGQVRAEQAATTRRAILTAARRLFVEQGYFGTATEEIVAEARWAPGARCTTTSPTSGRCSSRCSKRWNATSRRRAGARARRDALVMLRHGLHSFLDAAAVDPAVQRIVLIDGPAVLGWETWRGLEEQFGLGVLRQALDSPSPTV